MTVVLLKKSVLLIDNGKPVKLTEHIYLLCLPYIKIKVKITFCQYYVFDVKLQL